MPESQYIENEFLRKLSGIIEDNISDEQFGVSELAAAVGMSRSNLLRKIKKQSDLSVSQFIRQIRLNKAMGMLQDDSYNVSEVCFQVGFSSTSYFIKCFREHFGYPPGEVGKRELDEAKHVEEASLDVDAVPVKNNRTKVIWGLMFLAALVAAYLIFSLDIFKQHEQSSQSTQEPLKKSIAVLPFINDSDDFSNVYIINGLMESILSNLQKIEDLKVVSRTSVEKYRNNSLAISEIAKELNVSYIVEGSGQKIGNEIMLHIQLIDASNDQHLWAQAYQREAKDIFSLQMEVAKDIAGKIEAVITPEEEEQIMKVPTDNLLAYDYFLQGLDLLYTGTPLGYEEAILYFKKAIEEDHEFALAYADLAITYYAMDMYKSERKYAEEINLNADNALLFDPQLAQGLMAKGFFYMYNYEYDLALPYLEKALEYNPNSALVINTLSDFYTRYIPNTEKYLEYALLGVQLDIASNDSTTASYIYLHLSNAFIQCGFVDEAEMYINKSLDYDPTNLFSEYVKAFILYSKNQDLEQTKDLLLIAHTKDTTRLDIVQEIAKIYYYMRDYEMAYAYYHAYNEVKEMYGLDMYRGEDAKIAVVYDKVGQTEASSKYFNAYKAYADNDHSIYKNLSLSAYYSYRNEKEKALDYLKLFSQESNYHYWLILFLEIDPLMDNIKDLPEFKRIMDELKSKFWDEHEQIKASLEAKGLI